MLRWQVDFMPVYAQHLRNIIKEGINHPDHPDQPLKGFHILLDAGNGGGGFLATSVLEPLGANIEGQIFCPCIGWAAPVHHLMKLVKLGQVRGCLMPEA